MQRVQTFVTSGEPSFTYMVEYDDTVQNHVHEVFYPGTVCLVCGLDTAIISKNEVWPETI